MLELLNSSLRLSTPLIFAAMGGLICERSGIPTICLEGVMLVAAFTGAAINLASHSWGLGMVVAIFSAAIFMSLHAFLTQKVKANAIVSATAINLIAAGITPALSKVFFESSTNSPSIPMSDRIPEFLGHSPLVFLALLLPFVVHYVLYRTVPGLWCFSAGEGENALKSAGISRFRVRLGSLFIGGAIAGFGGIYLSMAHTSQFTRDMTAGRGFIALTAVIFGKWRPIPALVICLLFGMVDSLQIQGQGSKIMSYIPNEITQSLPYLITLVVLVVAGGKASAPKELREE